MQNPLQRFFLTLVLYLSVCACTFVFITPFSFTSFVGPAAGIATALVVFWGTRILSAIIVATVIFSWFLYSWLSLTIELSMVVITLLAIVLQGFWAKQITQAEVNKQNWLKSRRGLLTFLFKVGPLISLVSAFSVVVITMLESKELSNNLLFIFVSSWSSSTLFSIFFTPLLLLSQGRHQLNTSKRLFIILASLLAAVTIGLLFNISQNVQQHQRQDTFKQVKKSLLQKIQQEIAYTIDQVDSLSALFKARNKVNKNEFEVFSQQIMQKKTSSVRVLEWAPLINHENRIRFENEISNINEKNLVGELQKASVRSHYAPIQYIYPSLNNRQVLGLDVLTNSEHIIDMASVINDGKTVASAPISLVQDDHTNLGVLFISAIYSTLDNSEVIIIDSAEQNQVENLLGFVVAVVQFERFFQGISPLEYENMALFIEDVTSQEPYIVFGKQLDENYRHVERTVLNVNLRKWRVSLGESRPWQMQEKNWQVWGMLLGLTLGGLLFQVLILMMAVYSNELSAQVVRKTRELIIAKEQSEHENTAKTNFLHTLTNELQAPLQAISHFCGQLYKSEPKAQSDIIQDIELAQKNMQNILLMVVDLSKIELGELIVNNETLDFHGFLWRVESMIKVNKAHLEKNITFLIDQSVPHFINSDEFRIQQLLLAFCEGALKIYGVNNLRLSIKVHNHKYNSATLLFVFTSQDTDINASLKHYVSKDVALCGANMAMAKDVCQLMGGDASLALSASGEQVLTASIKIDITSNEQQQVYQAKIFD